MYENLGVYDKSKIGKLISFGSDHIIYNYGADKVIKFSVIERFLGRNGREKVERDYIICKQFFGKYILDTEFKLSPDGKQIVDIQPKILGHYLAKEDLAEPFINSQFREIMEAYSALVAAGDAKIDFVGKDGVLKNCMSNIFVTPSGQLSINRRDFAGA